MDRHISDQPSQAVWQLLTHQSGNVQSWPGVRGGHQLCLDVDAQLIYMFGGWDGSQDLADLWVYDIERRHWKCLCRDASEHVRNILGCLTVMNVAMTTILSFSRMVLHLALATRCA